MTGQSVCKVLSAHMRYQMCVMDRVRGSYLQLAGTQIRLEPTVPGAAVQSPSLKPGLGRYEGGRHADSILREGEQRVGETKSMRERKRRRERVQPRITHLVRVGEERSEENSTLQDLSPISVKITD